MDIRKANLTNLDELAELLDGYRQFYKQSSALDDCRKYIRERIQKQDSVIFIARIENDQTVGFAQLFPSFSSVSLKPVWHLNDLFVKQQYRQLNVATHLLNAVKNHAISTEASTIKLVTAVDNKNAKALYEKFGFKQVTAFEAYSLQLI